MSIFRQIFIFTGLLIVFVTGCAKVPQPRSGGSDLRAVEILQQSADAHGSAALRQSHDVNVRLEGTWSGLVARVQPVLVDERFRGTSEERYLLQDGAVGQAHVGPGGQKQVYRDIDTIRVWYNGVESDDKDVRDAAALVADNYRMFLLGPYFFQERSATVQCLGKATVDGLKCEHVLAVLKPGMGNSDEDRVVISIDRKRHLVRRVRITVDGLESTRGAVADIFLRDHIRVGGVLWPTHFYERLKRPFPASVHRWRLTGIDLDRKLERSSIDGSAFKDPATRPAGMK